MEVFSRQGYHLTQWIQGRNLGITCVVVSLVSAKVYKNIKLYVSGKVYKNIKLYVSGKVYKNIKLYASGKVCKKTECMALVLIPGHTIAKCGGRVGTE